MSSQRDNITKAYATDEVVVEWEPRLCTTRKTASACSRRNGFHG
jgi:hypothetical protein